MKNTNEAIAEVLGIRPSMMYKIRRGDRHPGFKTMLRIQEITKWSVNEQVEARIAGNYSEKFVEVLSSSVEQLNNNA